MDHHSHMNEQACVICNEKIILILRDNPTLLNRSQLVRSLCEVYDIEVPHGNQEIPICSHCAYNVGKLAGLSQELEKLHLEYANIKDTLSKRVQMNVNSTLKKSAVNLNLLADCATNPGITNLQWLLYKSSEGQQSCYKEPTDFGLFPCQQQSQQSEFLKASSETSNGTIGSEQYTMCDSEDIPKEENIPEDLSVKQKLAFEKIENIKAQMPTHEMSVAMSPELSRNLFPSPDISVPHSSKGSAGFALSHHLPSCAASREKSSATEDPVDNGRRRTLRRTRLASHEQVEPKRDEQTRKKSHIESISEKTQQYKNEDGTYLCPDCPRVFRRMYTFWDHFKTHTGEGPSCEICEKIFPRGHNLALHMRTHTGEKPYECPTCSKKFTDTSNLKVHMRLHTGERPYKCAVCKKGFTSSSRLRIHQMQHTGERPFPCSKCPKCFCKRAQLQNHIRKVHTQEGLPAHSCSICSKKYSSQYSLKVHMKKLHGKV